MRGHLNGVAAQIQSGTPAAFYVHCLALQTVGRQCVPIRDALDLVMGVADLNYLGRQRTDENFKSL